MHDVELPPPDAPTRGWGLLRGSGAAPHEAAQSADAAPAPVVAHRVSVQGKAGSTGDRPGYGLAAVLARRMSGDDVLTELLLDAGAGVDTRYRARRGGWVPGAGAADGPWSWTTGCDAGLPATCNEEG